MDTTSVEIQQPISVDESFLQIVKRGTIKAGVTLKETVVAVFSETADDAREAEGLINKISTVAYAGSVALLAAGSQVADRFRVPESWSIPLAIATAQDVAAEHGGNWGAVAGAGALTAGVYATQFVIGGAWGLGIKRFTEAANVFDSGINLFLKHLPLNAVLLKTFIGQDRFVLLNPNFV